MVGDAVAPAAVAEQALVGGPVPLPVQAVRPERLVEVGSLQLGGVGQGAHRTEKQGRHVKAPQRAQGVACVHRPKVEWSNVGSGARGPQLQRETVLVHYKLATGATVVEPQGSNRRWSSAGPRLSAARRRPAARCDIAAQLRCGSRNARWSGLSPAHLEIQISRAESIVSSGDKSSSFGMGRAFLSSGSGRKVAIGPTGCHLWVTQPRSRLRAERGTP